MPTRELLAPAQRGEFTELPPTLDDRILARFYTLSDHDLQLIRRHRRPSTQLGLAVQVYRELAGWLLPIALGTAAGPVLVGALFDELRERKILAPALSTIERLAWETRRRAQRLVFVRLTAALTDAQRAQLDALLVVPVGARITPLAQLRQPLSRPTPATFLALTKRIQLIRALGLNRDVARQVHQTRLARLAREGARYSPQFLQRFSPERRYATLVAFLLETSANLTDQALELHDRLMGQYHTQTRQAHAERFQQNGRAINEKVRLYASVGASCGRR